MLGHTAKRAVPVLGARGAAAAAYDAPPAWRPSANLSDVEEAKQRWSEALKQQGATGDRYLIVGAGSVGSRIAQALLQRGETQVRCFDMHRGPGLEALEDAEGPTRVEFVQGDVTQLAQVEAACQGVDTVFSTFAIIRFWERLENQRALSHRVNVGGTVNVIDASRKAGVQRLIQTSTSNVALTWQHEGSMDKPVVLDETFPYVEEGNRINHYGTSKAQAEQLVLAANGVEGGRLTTGAIRPCSGVFGARDSLILENALKTKSVPILAPATFSDWIYVDNVVWGHLLLEKLLQAKDPNAVGKAFAVTNGQPVTAKDFWSAIAYYDPTVKLQYPPSRVLHGLAFFVEALSHWFDLQGLHPLNQMTPAMLKIVSSSYIYDDSLARDVLGYRPMFALHEAILASVLEFQANQSTQKE